MNFFFIIIFSFSFIYSQCIGDINNDNDINVLDVIMLVNLIVSDDEGAQVADANLDGVLNILDVILVVNSSIEDSNPCDILWGDETNSLPEYYLASDIGEEQFQRVVDYYNIAHSEWGNYGPLEFWIIGTDVDEAESMDQLYCEIRMDKNPCLGSNYLQWCLNRDYSFVDYALYGGAGLSMMREEHWNCEGYSYMEITLSSKYPFPNESDYDVVTMHEYFHAYQQAHIFTFDYNERAELMVVNPWWSEGGAEYMAQLLYSKQPGIYSNYLRDRMEWKMHSKNDLLDNEFISDIPYGERAYIAYDLGAWAIVYLISLVGEDRYRIDFYNDLNDYGWEESFIRNFNMTSYQFLTEFHEFLDLDIEDQLSILPN